MVALQVVVKILLVVLLAEKAGKKHVMGPVEAGEMTHFPEKEVMA